MLLALFKSHSTSITMLKNKNMSFSMASLHLCGADLNIKNVDSLKF